MTAAQVAGLILLFLPFVGLFIFVTKEISLAAAVGIFAATAALTGIIMLGSFLLVGGA